MRLTIDTNSEYGYELKADNPNTSIAQDTASAIQKLGQLEDIEEELGINLVTLFKALDKKQRIFVLNKYDMRVVELPIRYASRKLIDGEIFINTNGCFAVFKIKDYGKSWALTKEELK